MVRPDTFWGVANELNGYWKGLFEASRPLAHEFRVWYGIDYPDENIGGATKNQRGQIASDTGLAICVANAKSYSWPHLIQLGHALDNDASVGLREHLGEASEVILVDVGCATGILSLFADRIGFAHYVGIDPNEWMRRITRAVFQTTLNQVALSQHSHAGLPGYGGYVERQQYAVHRRDDGRVMVDTVVANSPSFSLFPEIDASYGWLRFIENVVANGMQSSATARGVTVLIVMNHLLHQETGVAGTVQKVIDVGQAVAGLGGVNAYLISIEPKMRASRNALGTQGLDELLRARGLDYGSFGVPSVKAINRVKATNEEYRDVNSPVRLVKF